MVLPKKRKKLTDLETILGGEPLGRNIYAPEAWRKHTTDIEAYSLLV